MAGETKMKRINPPPFDTPKSLDELKKTAFDKLLMRQDIRQFREMHELTMSDFDRDLLALVKYQEDAEICDHCPGFLRCPKLAKGFRLQLTYDDQLGIQNHVHRCAPAEAFLAVSQNYIRRDFADELIAIRLTDIDIPTTPSNRRKVLISFLQAINDHKPIDQGFFLFGPSGIGKSFMLIAFLNELALKGNLVAFVHFKTLVEEIRNLIKNGQGELATKRMQELQKVNFLVIDDLGREKISEWSRDSLLWELVDERSRQKGKITFFTAYDAPGVLMRDYQLDASRRHERIFSRISELSKEVLLDGLNRR